MSSTRRVGRNEPCPCGSGKKHKACCGARADVAPDPKGSSAKLFALAAIGVAVAGGLVFQLRGGSGAAPSASPASVLPATPPAAPSAPFARTPSAPAPQPPGEAPPGKVWSPEHGHWHDAPAAGQTPTVIRQDPSGNLVPSTQSPATPSAPVPQPPGEAPPGKVWSPEHGHWHDAAADAGAPATPAPGGGSAPAPDAPAPETPAPE